MMWNERKVVKHIGNLALFYRGCNLDSFKSSANQSTYHAAKVQLFLGNRNKYKDIAWIV